MGWVMFEIFLALCLAIFIVWWTLPKSRKRNGKKVDAHTQANQDDRLP